MARKEKTTYGHLDVVECILDFWIVRKAITGWHRSARSRQVLIVIAGSRGLQAESMEGRESRKEREKLESDADRKPNLRLMQYF